MAQREFLGRYMLASDEPVATGGMAKIYKAVDLQNGGFVAIKILQFDNADNELLKEAFSRELMALQDLGVHDFILTVLDYGRTDEEDLPFLVLEWAPRTIRDAYKGNSEWDHYYVNVGRNLLNGLSFAYSRSILHRDIKPQNILVTPDDGVRIADFGIAKFKNIISQRTLAKYKTPEYSPPEESPPMDSIDPYSFVISSICCISNSDITHIDEVSQYIEQDLVADDKVKELLLSAISKDPETRPDNIVDLSASLERIFKSVQPRVQQIGEIAIKLSRAVISRLSETLMIDNNTQLENWGIEQLNNQCYIEYTYNPDNSSEESFTFITEDILFTGKIDRTETSRLILVDCHRIPPPRYDRASHESLASQFLFSDHRYVERDTSERSIQLLRETASAFDLKRQQTHLQTASASFLGSCRKAIEVQFEILRASQRPVTYTSFEVAGRRATFKLDPGDYSNSTRVGEHRLVSTKGQVYARGEIEKLENNHVTLYADNLLDNEALPLRGQLIFDIEATRSALVKQQKALEAAHTNTGVRSNLKSLIENPSNQAEGPLEEVTFFDDNLDDAKKDAIRRALSTDAFCIVHGPPGTGKTKFIAELLKQLHARNFKTILTAQSHSALDNAIEGVEEGNNPGTRHLTISRVGRSDDNRISEGVRKLLISSNLEPWVQDVSHASRIGLNQWAERNGISLDEVEVVKLLSRLRSLREAYDAQLNEHEGLQGRKTELEEDYNEKQFSGTLSLNTTRIDQRLIELAALISTSEKNIEKLRKRIYDAWEQLVKLETFGSDPFALSIDEIKLFEKDWINFEQGNTDPVKVVDAVESWLDQLSAAPEMQTAFLISSDVVSGTCVGIASAPLDKLDFEYCVVDEAAKASPPEVLVPMVRARKWVLVGDTRQLPPYLGDYKQNRDICRDMNFGDPEQKQTILSFLEKRLPGHAQVFLNTQYRMCKPIGNLISDCFYKGELRSEREFDALHLIAAMAIRAPITWFSTEELDQNRERRHGTSFYNFYEVNIIEKLLGRIDFAETHNGTKRSVACISGYAAQNGRLEDMIDRTEWQSIKPVVGTIDSFQGREADIVVISLVRSNHKFDLGFMDDRERINVALSRARDALVIVGNAACVRNKPPKHPMNEVLTYILDSSDSVLEVLND